MTNRHKKIVLEAEEGITFEVSEAGDTLVIKAHSVVQNIVKSIAPNIRARSVTTDNVRRKLPTVLAGQYAEELSCYTDKDGNQAVVLPGWTVSGVEKENTIWGKDVSLVIYRIPKGVGSIDWADHHKLEQLKKTHAQLVWIPVELLKPNGTLDGENFTEKFGRRNYRNDVFSPEGFNEPLEGGLLKQMQSIDQYGGFYISRYNISRSPEGAPQSLKGCKPWANISWYDALEVAATFECSDFVQSQMTCGSEYDSKQQWLIESGCKTLEEVVEDSTSWGNNWRANEAPKRVVETGSREEWCANNVYDAVGNVNEWTQERYGSSLGVMRGCGCSDFGFKKPAAYRCKGNPGGNYYDTGFRITVYVK